MKQEQETSLPSRCVSASFKRSTWTAMVCWLDTQNQRNPETHPSKKNVSPINNSFKANLSVPQVRLHWMSSSKELRRVRGCRTSCDLTSIPVDGSRGTCATGNSRAKIPEGSLTSSHPTVKRKETWLWTCGKYAQVRKCFYQHVRPVRYFPKTARKDWEVWFICLTRKHMVYKTKRKEEPKQKGGLQR